ncbi:MAG TPA: hypothetical protein VK766_05785 [Cytophagaceae bacterium]|nr:hypothetical protein [Cytophagaceae bacterium]
MPRIKSKNLYELIKSMNKNEKRYFKVTTSFSEEADDKKGLLLFDEINKQDDFDENKILKKNPSLKASQLSNLKAYLHERILQSLRQFHLPKIMDIQIREQIDYAQLLFERRLYDQGKNCLRKAKKMAQLYNNLELQLEIIKLEKGVLTQTTEDGLSRVDDIIKEVRNINSQINNLNLFSNLFIKLNSFYTRIGYIRDEVDYVNAKEYFYSSLPEFEEENLSLIEKIYLYRLYVGYYFFVQDFENGYLYSKKLEELFETSATLIETNTEDYIKALNNLLISQYKLFRYHEFEETNKKLQNVSSQKNLQMNESMRIRLLKYYYTNKVNHFFMTGNFDKGIEFIMHNNGEEINFLMSKLDRHSSMIFSYKVACLYFGAGNFSQSIRWLNKIINAPDIDFRQDLHCFARILNLVCHYELGNFDVIKYYIISTYRFLWKKEDLHFFQKYILGFLKNLNTNLNNKDLIDRFQKLKTQLMPLVNSDFEKRAFIYFDIISWLESKIERRTVQEIIKDKFKEKIAQ